MTATDYPLSQNPAYFPTEWEKPWSKPIIFNFEQDGNQGEPPVYNITGIYVYREQGNDVEIIICNARAVGYGLWDQPDTLMEDCRTYLRALFEGYDVEFDTTCQGTKLTYKHGN